MTPIRAAAALVLLLCINASAMAANVTFSGNVSYAGSHGADSIYVVALDNDTDVVLGIDRIAAGTPPYTLPFPFSFTFDNAGVVDVFIVGVLDRDGSGLNGLVVGGTAGPSTLTPGDVFGWYPGQQVVTLLSPAADLLGLNFALPTAEIRGNVTTIGGQTNAFIVVTTQVGGDVDGEFELSISASGAYEIVGVYPGTWIVQGISDQGDVCFGDPTCASPTSVSVVAGEIRNGVDIDFTPLPNDASSWGGVKSLYR